MTLDYNYPKRRIKNPPDISYQISHISRLIVWIPSRLSWNPVLPGRDRSLLHPIFTKAFTGTSYQAGPGVF